MNIVSIAFDFHWRAVEPDGNTYIYFSHEEYRNKQQFIRMINDVNLILIRET